jgi:hypothetical protein
VIPASSTPSFDRLFAAAEARELDRQLALLDLLAARATTPQLRAELDFAYLQLLRYAARIIARMARGRRPAVVLQ